MSNVQINLNRGDEVVMKDGSIAVVDSVNVGYNDAHITEYIATLHCGEKTYKIQNVTPKEGKWYAA